MATIGLDKLFYAPITEDENEEETYGTPVQLAKAISVELSVELAEAVLYADDGIAQIIKEFNSGTLTLGVDDIGLSAASELTGAEIDSNGVLVSTSEDDGKPVAVGFRAKKANGKYRYFWLYLSLIQMCIRDRPCEVCGSGYQFGNKGRIHKLPDTKH